jgi:hypothetical protein
MCKFIHIRTNRNNVKGGKTVAYEEADGVVVYAVAKCHERDNFCRRTGRVKAEGRLKSARYVKTLELLDDQSAVAAILGVES